jgi:hypothetical protein
MLTQLIEGRSFDMAIWDYRPKADLWTGVAVGVGLLVAPVIIPMIVAAARPVVKAVIKGGFMVYEKGCEMVAEGVEMVEDLAAEAKSEVAAELAAAKKEGA